MQKWEGLGDKFNLEKYFHARELCCATVELIHQKIESGMREIDGQLLIKDEFRKAGVAKFWHPAKFRIGKDTLKSFRELPDPTLQISAGEIFFIDVGPIIDEHEADYGKTFVFEDQDKTSTQLSADTAVKKLAEATIEVWQETQRNWSQESLTGAALYAAAEKSAQKLGYRLNMEMGGHRLGDFPHALFTKEDLAAVADFVPAPNLWVLEIHLCSDALQRGAFFEDILTRPE